MSTTISGRITSIFMRSRSVVPPARNWAGALVGAPLAAGKTFNASGTVCARS
jgi:hypothetical protein